jgi:hypothetical protein
MTELQKKILDAFTEYIFGFMQADLKAAINGKANYLAALGLVSYTEVLGGLKTGKLGLRGQSKANFEAFLPYLGEDYTKAQDAIQVYSDIRCALVHQYFISGNSTIWTGSTDGPGIMASSDGQIHFFVDSYLRDLIAGAKRFLQDILEGRQNLAENFEEGMKRIKVW